MSSEDPAPRQPTAFAEALQRQEQQQRKLEQQRLENLELQREERRASRWRKRAARACEDKRVHREQDRQVSDLLQKAGLHAVRLERAVMDVQTELHESLALEAELGAQLAQHMKLADWTHMLGIRDLGDAMDTKTDASCEDALVLRPEGEDLLRTEGENSCNDSSFLSMSCGLLEDVAPPPGGTLALAAMADGTHGHFPSGEPPILDLDAVNRGSDIVLPQSPGSHSDRIGRVPSPKGDEPPSANRRRRSGSLKMLHRLRKMHETSQDRTPFCDDPV
jgi:hypothetical protein